MKPSPFAYHAPREIAEELAAKVVMLPQVEGIASLEALLRTRRELLFARFRELWQAAETQRALEAL